MQDGLNAEFTATVSWIKFVLEIVFKIYVRSPGRGLGVGRSAGTAV